MSSGDAGQHIFYFDAAGSLQEVWWSGGGWAQQNLGAGVGAAPAGPGSGIAAIEFSGDAGQHISGPLRPGGGLAWAAKRETLELIDRAIDSAGSK